MSCFLAGLDLYCADPAQPNYNGGVRGATTVDDLRTVNDLPKV